MVSKVTMFVDVGIIPKETLVTLLTKLKTDNHSSSGNFSKVRKTSKNWNVYSLVNQSNHDTVVTKVVMNVLTSFISV